MGSDARRNVILTAAIAGLGGLLFGYDTGIIASAMLFIRSDLDLSSFQQGVVVAAVAFTAGSLVAPVATRRLDERPSWSWWALCGAGAVVGWVFAPTGLAATCSSLTLVPTLVRSSVRPGASTAQVAASHHASNRGVASTSRSPDPSARAVSCSATVWSRVAEAPTARG